MQPIVEVTHTCRFAAAHRLAAPGLDPDANAARFGPCARDHGHGWSLEVCVVGPVDPATGMVVDFARLGRLVHERIVAVVDHRHLDRDVPFLSGRITTAENLAVAFWRELAPFVQAWPGCALRQVVVVEDTDHRVAYRGSTPGTVVDRPGQAT